jgi:serine/threonine protein kinase
LIAMPGTGDVVRISDHARLGNAGLWAIQPRGYPVCPHEAEDAMTSRMPGPAERLEGRTLGRWRVLERIDGHDGASSVGYRVAGPNGENAYLKAYDFSRAFASDRDFPTAIEEIAGSYRLERDLVARCNESGMSRVVRGLDQGEIQFDDSRLPIMYIVFELAEGDLRHRLQTVEQIDVAARLQMLHHAAVGLRQLHGSGLVHQDIKPANVLTFAEEGAKLGDLAHACEQAGREPALEALRSGDRSYAPPEALYGFAMADIDLGRQARDVYLFGSLILFAFVEVSTTSALLSKLAPAHRPKAGRVLFEEILPYLIEAFDQVVDEFIDEAHPPDLLIASFRELCHPDPRQRGDSKARVARHANPYSLERHITRLNLLHNRARRMVAPARRAA